VIAMGLSPQYDVNTQDVPARPLDRIVVGVDFTEVSLAAAQWVGRHLARDATLTLVHVIPPPPLPNVLQLRAARMPDPESRLRTRLQSMRGALHGLAGVVGGTTTGVEVRVGDPAVQLPAYANMVDADLLVVGANSVFHAAPRRETATTDRLLRRLARPGLVARNVQSAPKTVLVALADDAAASVLDVARMVAAPSGARLVALRLADRGPAGDTTVSVKPRDAVANDEQVRMIVDVTRELRADVIVIGSYTSATNVDDDVAHLLAGTADCSVLVVPYRTVRRPRRRLHLDVLGHVQRSLAAGSQPDDAGPPRPAATVCGTDDAA